MGRLLFSLACLLQDFRLLGLDKCTTGLDFGLHVGRVTAQATFDNLPVVRFHFIAVRVDVFNCRLNIRGAQPQMHRDTRGGRTLAVVIHHIVDRDPRALNLRPAASVVNFGNVNHQISLRATLISSED